ncbi:hypothetical protein ACQ4PT_053252 [Festuca glaucescens]
MDDGKRTTERHHITAHGTTTLDVVYTNMVESVDEVLVMYEQWLETNELGKYRFVGLDLEYTVDQQQIAIVQLALGKHVLIFHYCRSSEIIPALKEFLTKKGITFASVDTSGDKRVLGLAGIKILDEYHVDIQDVFKIDSGYDIRDAMGKLVEVIINESYMTMKDKFPKDRHNYWEWKPLEKINLHYAAIDGYVSYELYRRIKDLKHGQRHIQAS